MNSIIMALLAVTTVYRLELTDETPYIVGQDGVKREVCIVEPDEYAVLTGRLESVWASLHKSKDGRKRLHGNIVTMTIDEKNAVAVEEYADGYRHTEPMERKVVRSKAVAAKNEKRPSNMSARQWAMRQAIFKQKTAKPKIVTVEHDAATGKDTVK